MFDLNRLAFSSSQSLNNSLKSGSDTSSNKSTPRGTSAKQKLQALFEEALVNYYLEHILKDLKRTKLVKGAKWAEIDWHSLLSDD